MTYLKKIKKVCSIFAICIFSSYFSYYSNVSNVNKVILCHDSFYFVRNFVSRILINGFSHPNGGIMHVMHILLHFTGTVA